MKALVTTALGLVLLAPGAAADFITGRVVDSNGVGVQGVDIDVKEETTGQQPLIFNDGTNASGFFTTTLPPGVYTVTFRPPKPPATTHLFAEVEGVVVFGTTNMGVITLPRGVSLSGRTIDENQIPVQNVDVDVIDPATGNEVQLQGDNTTALGLFDIAVPPGPIEVEFHTNNVLGPMLAPIAMDLDLSSNTALGDVTLLPGFTVTGHVQDALGLGVQGADVDVVDRSTREEQFTPGDNTNANGDFSVVVRAGTFNLEICPQPSQLLVATTIENLVVAGSVGVGTSTLGPGVVLSGTVLDAKGNPAARVDVDVADSVSGQAVTLCGDTTNALGRYSVIVPAGTLDVEFERRCRSGAMRRDVHLGVAVAGTTVLDGQLPGCPRPPRRYAGSPTALGSVNRSLPLSPGGPVPDARTSLLPESMTYGAGIAGAGGLVPRLSLSADATGPVLEIEDAVGGATALLVTGPRPAGWRGIHAAILVEPVRSQVRLLNLGGAPGLPGAGSASLPIPDVDALAGYWQLVVLDPAAPGGVALSEGLRIDVD